MPNLKRRIYPLSEESKVIRHRIRRFPAKSRAQRSCVIMGFILIGVGILGFMTPALAGISVNAAPHWIHILTGVAALAVGFSNQFTTYAAERLTLWLGGFYALLGVAGFVLGTPGTFLDTLDQDAHILPLFPSMILGTPDHVLHLLVGIVLILAGISSAR